MIAVSVGHGPETEAELDMAALSELLQNTLHLNGVAPPAEVSLSFVSSEEIAALNATYMGSDGPTDVLSFPIDQNDAVPAGVVRMLGDIVICADVARRNASTHTGSFDDELALLVVHSALHLLGHDHANDIDRAAMWHAERMSMREFWRPLSRDPWTEA